ncbi:MAG: DUF488 family protein [Arenicella sp.]
MSETLYTIGYATKPIEVFVAQLKEYGIDVVADVRSVPYSKIFHDYHREALAAYLKQHGIAYTFVGDELGPRSKDDAHYDESGQVQFDRLMQSELFGQGVVRLSNGVSKGYTIALMCAEKDPATCHRSLLVSYFLLRNGYQQILHIGHDGSTENQMELEQRLCDIHGVNDDLFMSSAERAERAYQLQLKNTSYYKPE